MEFNTSSYFLKLLINQWISAAIKRCAHAFDLLRAITFVIDDNCSCYFCALQQEMSPAGTCITIMNVTLPGNML